MLEKKVLISFEGSRSKDKCPECGSPTIAQYEDDLGILCGRKGTTTKCTKCQWQEFYGMMA